jgi:YVTN family beta-propeller protein
MKPKNHAVKALVAMACWMTASMASAQSTSIFQQNFASGLGNFTSAGTVKTGTTGAVMTASTLSTDGTLTSGAISTKGFTNITVSYDRVTAGLVSFAGDSGIVEYSINGGAFVRLESTKVTASSRATFTLPAAANNASIVLRFRIAGVSNKESLTVNNLTVTGTPTSTGGGGGGGGTIGSAPAIGEFTAWEAGHVRPMALNADGTKLYVVNTPDARVEVFDVTGATPVLKESIPVGLEPVAVAFAPNGQLWVVNHLSDSISVVDVSGSIGKVVNTLYTGDEPRDIVFAGPGNRWAFVTTAHRGQNAPFDPQFATPGIGRADVWVFDATNPGSKLGGAPKTILNMFGDTPRALARSADGSRVYAAVFHSGNKTTIAQGGPGGVLDKTGPTTAADGSRQPATGLIVQKNANGDWVDGGDPARGIAPKTWNANIKLNLPDYDVFTIDATTAVPTVDKSKTVSGVGTTLFNMAVNPVNGKVYVSNQEARNVVRFEGPGSRSTTVNGNFVEARITVIDGTTPQPRRLNKHVTSYGKGLGTAAEKAAAVATPLEMAISPDGNSLYMASMGTNKLVRYNTAQLENDSFNPTAASQLALTGGLPTGVVLDANRKRAYVTTRLDNGVSVVNTDTFTEGAHVKMHNPEPEEIVKGRRFMYDAAYTSSRGDSSCAGCHIFGDMDHLSWDLGNPDGVQVTNPNKYSDKVPAILRTMPRFHPMKGPMATQTFRGMAGNGPMHWRGDRTGTKASGASLEERAFKEFNEAFVGLLGRNEELEDAEMTEYARFVLKLISPPNPVANLDGTYTPAQKAGFDFFMNSNADTISTCNGCHVLDPVKGKFGTDGTLSFEGPTIQQNAKIAHLRELYQKVGSFARNSTQNSPPSPQMGDQIRGFGYSLDGALGSVNEFLNALVFLPVSADNRAKLQEFLLAFPTEVAPIVGQQVTITSANASQADVKARLDLLISRAKITSPRPECELVAKAVVGGTTRGWVHSRASDTFVSDRKSEGAVNLTSLLSLASTSSAPITFTCAAPGNGTRLGISRKADGTLDGGI